MKRTHQQIFNDNLNTATNTFQLDYTPINTGLMMVHIEGVFQSSDLYSVSGRTLTFNFTVQQGFNVVATYDYLTSQTPPTSIPDGDSGPVSITAKSTIVQGVTSEMSFMLTEINGVKSAIPLYKFESSEPELDFLGGRYTDLVINNATLINDASAYNAGVAFTIQETTNPNSPILIDFAFPLYKISQKMDIHTGLQINEPTLVGDLSSTDYFIAASVNGEMWGIPLKTYSVLLPEMVPVNPGDILITTQFEINPTQWDAPRSAGSTTLNSKIKTYADLVKRTKMHLGWPIVELEICDEQIVDHIDTAIEWYTKYAGFTEEFLIFDSNIYQPGVGVKMDEVFSQLYCMSQNEPRMSNKQAQKTEMMKTYHDYDLDSYRKVVDVWSFDEGGGQQSDYLFSLEYVFAQQTYFSYVLGNYGFDLVTWHILKDWIDTREKMFALNRRYYFDDRTQRLRLVPEPGDMRFIGIVGCYVEKPIKDLIMERWVYQYTSALTKITIGNIRGKFSSVSMFGGGTINYNDLLSQGLKERDELQVELLDKHGEVAPIKFFVGSFVTALLAPASALLLHGISSCISSIC